MSTPPDTARKPPWLARLTAAQLNGLTVAAGVALIQVVLAVFFGGPAAASAASGAVCTSLPDVPNTARRTRQRVWPAAVVVTLVTLLVGICRPWPWAMTALIALISFTTLMAMVWGPRAGPLSFSGTLAMVFAMAQPAPDGPGPDWPVVLAHTGWVIVGAIAYAFWAVATARAMGRRNRRLAVASAVHAAANRLRSRAKRIAGQATAEQNRIRASIRDDRLMAEALQAARDQVYPAADRPDGRWQTATLLRLIDLRDLLLASRLDLDQLGQDQRGRLWRAGIADMLTTLASQLDLLAEAVRIDGEIPVFDRHARDARTLHTRIMEELEPPPPGDPRRGVVGLLRQRLLHMLELVEAMHQHAQGRAEPLPLPRDQLQQFISPEGWPLAAFKGQFTLKSDVMRHALRGALALSLAWMLGLALPWATHPHWLVLSVAVVLRGNLEQTLSRRNDRVVGTVIGCLLVLLLARIDDHLILSAFFLVSVGITHAYVNVRYRVSSATASVMALLQPLLVLPGSHLAVGERLADTAIGALLAWAFSFVLPSWERRHLGRLMAQLRLALLRHGEQVMQPVQGLPLQARLTRQRAYSALGAVAAAAQRSAVEPRGVRLPDHEVEAVLSHGYRLMALLGILRQFLARRADAIDLPAATDELHRGTGTLQTLLGADAASAGPLVAPVAAEPEDWQWPAEGADLTPWVRRRIQLCTEEAQRLSVATRALVAAVDRDAAPAGAAHPGTS